MGRVAARLSGVAGLLFALSACAPGGSTMHVEQAPANSDSLDLAFANYVGIREASGTISLFNGRWEGAPLAAGGASRPRVELLWALPPGELEGEGEPESVGLLTASAGGTGSQLYAAVFAKREGAWRNVATTPIGDRIQVRDARVEGGRLVLDVVQAGAGDAMCCPGELATRTWALRGDSLSEQPARMTGRLGPEVLDGSEWVLRNWSRAEAALPAPEVTLRSAEGRWTGSSGCNRYSASVTAGVNPGGVELGPAIGTRMACPEPANSIEARYLRALASVQKFSFVGGRLALSYQAEDTLGVLLFDRRPVKD